MRTVRSEYHKYLLARMTKALVDASKDSHETEFCREGARVYVVRKKAEQQCR